MKSTVVFSSGNDEWYTPDKIYRELNEEFNFDLDPCSTHENCKCEKHFTIEENGLLQNWGGAYGVLQPTL